MRRARWATRRLHGCLPVIWRLVFHEEGPGGNRDTEYTHTRQVHDACTVLTHGAYTVSTRRLLGELKYTVVSRTSRHRAQVAIKESETPGAGTYTPRTQGTISAAAEASKKKGDRLAGLRRSASAPRVTRTVEVTADGPGPGSYDPLARFHNESKKGARKRSAAFVSGARRALPWGGDYSNAPLSTRARNSDKIEDPADTPGPGEYGVPMYPSAVIGGKAAHKKRGANFGSTSAPRFLRDPHPDKVTPSPVHYTPR